MGNIIPTPLKILTLCCVAYYFILGFIGFLYFFEANARYFIVAFYIFVLIGFALVAIEEEVKDKTKINMCLTVITLPLLVFIIKDFSHLINEIRMLDENKVAGLFIFVGVFAFIGLVLGASFIERIQKKWKRLLTTRQRLCNDTRRQ